MPEVRVQDEQGSVHVFPDGSTPQMIAEAMHVQPPDEEPQSAISSQPQPTGSFLGGVYNATVKPLVDLEQQGLQEIQNNPGAGPMAWSGSLIAKMLGNTAKAQYQQGQQAYQNAKQGRYSEAAGHGLASAVPFFGPAAAQAGEDIGSGQVAQGLGEGAGLIGSVLAPRIAGKVADAIPNKARAGANFKQVMGKAKDVPIDTTASGNTALKIQEFASRGGRQPKVVSDFLRRATDPSKGPITYQEGRDFASNAGQLSADERNALKPNVRRMIGQFSRDLGNANADAANQAGVLPQYQSAMREYGRAMTVEDLKNMLKGSAVNAAKYAVPTAIGGAAAGYVAKKALGLK